MDLKQEERGGASPEESGKPSGYPRSIRFVGLLLGVNLKQEERGGASPEESGKPPGYPGCESRFGLLLGGCIGAIVGGAEIGSTGELSIGFNLFWGGIGGGVLGAGLGWVLMGGDPPWGRSE